jgi:enoyl-CoA hydratase/carnithine racemase
MIAAWAEAPGERPVLEAVRDGVGIVTLNRPERLNAWTPAMGLQYFDALERMAGDPAVRAILVHGQGRAFCAGADMSGLQEISEGADYKSSRQPRKYWFPLSIGKPIVAAIHGACMGLGVQQALCCDIRFVSDDVKIAAVYAKRGLVGEIGITWLLPRIVGMGVAMDLMVSGRAVGAQEALAIGLANRVVPDGRLFDEAFAYCAALAADCAPSSMRTMKQQVYADMMSALWPAFERSEVLLEQALASADFAEGVRAFKEKRPPQFPPLAAELAVIKQWP